MRRREWASRLVFMASALALLATSKPKGWLVTAATKGPGIAATGRGLELTIDASAAPRIRTTGAVPSFAGGRESPCLARWASGKSMSCLLPPGVTLDGVDISGSCGGCQNGCPPPPGSFVNATSSEVDVWHETATGSASSPVPLHGSDRIATSFEVIASGARFVVVHVEIVPHGGGAALRKEDQSCGLEPAGARAQCQFLLFDSVLAGAKDVDVNATVEGWDSCAAAPCASPKTLHVDAIRVTK